MEVKENKTNPTYFYPTAMRKELPVNFFLGKIVKEKTFNKRNIEKEKAYSELHNTNAYPVGTFQKPISNIL